MGKVTGFLEHPRGAPHRRPIAERVRDWREVEQTSDDAEAREQAGRCMDCGVPFCTSGCPLGNPIPDFADAVYRGDWQAAYRRLAATNDFPELTGRLCPAPCEAACVLAIGGPEAGVAGAVAGAVAGTGAVAIEATERAIAEHAFAAGWVAPPSAPARARTGKRVAIVGSGPAGLAAAAQLAERGHRAVIFEAAPRAGGLLRYGIPDFKIEKSVVDRRLALLARADGDAIELRTGAAVGVAPTWAALHAEYDAVIVAIGAQRPRDLAIPGRELAGVALAMDYLVDQNEVTAGERGDRAAPAIDARGKRVVILGGGDTGSDCLGTALRQGAASVAQIELVPAPPIGKNPATPWPTWPTIFRTSSSQEEGGARTFGFRTTRFASAPGAAAGAPDAGAAPGVANRIAAIHGIGVDRRGGELVDLPGTELELPCDLVILALGFAGPDATLLTRQLGVKLDPRGAIAVDARYETNVTGVFCAGDARRGASLVVWAIAEGRAAAHHADAYLRGGS